VANVDSLSSSIIGLAADRRDCGRMCPYVPWAVGILSTSAVLEQCAYGAKIVSRIVFCTPRCCMLATEPVWYHCIEYGPCMYSCTYAW
jgi:hypothetical protein